MINHYFIRDTTEYKTNLQISTTDTPTGPKLTIAANRIAIKYPKHTSYLYERKMDLLHLAENIFIACREHGFNRTLRSTCNLDANGIWTTFPRTDGANRVSPFGEVTSRFEPIEVVYDISHLNNTVNVEIEPHGTNWMRRNWSRLAKNAGFDIVHTPEGFDIGGVKLIKIPDAPKGTAGDRWAIGDDRVFPSITDAVNFLIETKKG